MVDETNYSCFVPSCKNKRFMAKDRLHFFRVPTGIEGHFWSKAVKNKRGNYEELIGLLSDTSSLYDLSKVTSQTEEKRSNVEYCCEVHFDFENDLDVVNDNGSVQYNIKPGVCPSKKPRQTKRLFELESTDSEAELNGVCIKSEYSITSTVPESNDDQLNHEEVISTSPKTNYISLVDISLLTNQMSQHEAAPPDNEQETIYGFESVEIKSEPMMPLTISLMKRKSCYYMGLDPSRCSNLLQSIIQRTHLNEEKIMLTLRKLRLNEDFEVLGDLFDIDKTVAEQYYEECKNPITEVMDTVSSPSNTNTTSELLITIEPPSSLTNLKESIRDEQKDNDAVLSSDSSSTNYGSDSDYELDPDVELESQDSCDSCDSRDSLATMPNTKENCHLCDHELHQLNRHMETVHLHPQLNKTICGLCHEKFKNKTTLQVHQKETHNGRAYACDTCGKMFTVYSRLKKHIYLKHSNIKTHLCHICGEGYPFEYRLSEHIENVHLQMRRYECNLCDKKYTQSQALTEHKRAVHIGGRPYKCDHVGCDKSYNRQSNLREHKESHSKIRLTCDICSKQFSYKTNLRTHQRNIHGKYVTQPLCK